MRTTIGIVAAAVLALGVYGATVTAAAGVRIEAQVRRTVSCTTSLRALQISAFAANSSIGAASVSITTGNPTSADGLLGISTRQPRYGLGGACHTAAKRAALTHRGLTSAGVVHAGDIRWPAVYCPASPRVLLRFVIGLDASAKPVSATVAIRTLPKPHSGKKSKQIGLVQWSPTRSVTYYASACTTQDQ
jgi:hypothetical protein